VRERSKRRGKGAVGRRCVWGLVEEKLRLCTNTNREFTSTGTRAGGGGRRLVCSDGTERGYSVKVGDCMRGPGPAGTRTMQTTIRNQVVDGWRSHYRAIVGRASVRHSEITEPPSSAESHARVLANARRAH
jgi:hypothetical protein